MEVLVDAAEFLVSPTYWLAVFAALILAAIVGLVPGVGSLLVMALILPFLIFNVNDPVIAIVMLSTISGTNNTLDSIPAVMVGLPSGSTQVTFLEGHQLARQGKAAHTMGAIYAVSAIGSIVGAIALAIVIPVIRPFVLSFNYSEIAMMALFGLAMVSALSRGAIVKGFIGALFGILLGTVGIDPLTGVERFTFGEIQLWEGLPVVATILGLFALPEMIDLSMTRQSVAPEGSKVSTREVLTGFRSGLTRWRVAIRQSLFGVFFGSIPGVGSSVIDWLSYALGIFFTKDKSEFGRGSLDGVLFAESAQNSKEAGQAIPTLALGIPGGTGWIMIIVAMLAFGIVPGPDMLSTYAHITVLIVITLALGNLLMVAVGLFATGFLTRLTLVPYPVIGFTIIPLAILSAFLDLTNWLAIPIVFSFTIVGLLMKRYQWPRPPLVLGFILGPIIDRNLQSALSIHGWDGVLTRPITIVLFVIAVVLSVVMYRAMGRSESTVAEVTEDTQSQPSGGAGDAPRRTWQLHWHQALIPILIAIGGAAAFLAEALTFPPRAQILPVSLTIGILLLSTVELIRTALRPKLDDVEILDIGMRSQGQNKAAMIVVGLFLLFTVLSVVAGLRYAAISLAVLGPILLMSGMARWMSAAIAGTIVALFAWILMDELMAVIWPDPAFWSWI